MSQKRWTLKEEKRLSELYPITGTRQLTGQFPGRSYESVRARATVLGLKKKVGHGRKFYWSKSLDAKLKELWPDNNARDVGKLLDCSEQSVYSRAYYLGLKKSAGYMKKYRTETIKNLIEGGANTRFKKGQKSWNKGQRLQDYASPESLERIKSSWFEKGHSPHNEKFDGCISIRKDTGTGIDYKYIRVSKGEWQLLSRHSWEKKTGERLGSDDVIRFKDGDSMNCSFSNLEKVSMAENLMTNTFSDVGVVKRFMKVKDPELQKEILEKHPELIELSRSSMKLKIKINKL